MTELEQLTREARRMENAYDRLSSCPELQAEYDAINARIAELNKAAYPAISQGSVVGPALVVEGVLNGAQVFEVFKRDQVSAAKARAAGVLEIHCIPAGVTYSAKEAA